MVLPTRERERLLAMGVGGPVERLQKNEAKIVKTMRIAIRLYFEPNPCPAE
jgi:hypothetical protein